MVYITNCCYIMKKKQFYDEILYSIGVMYIVIASWMIGAFPYAYWIFYSFTILGLLIIQYYLSVSSHQQFWMLELCYFINYSMLLFFILCIANICPWPSTVFRLLFTNCVGPLALSIPVFRNSLVFHDFGRLNILSLHFSPNAALWGMRWFPKQLEESFPGMFTAALSCGDDPQFQLNHFFSHDLCPGNFFDLYIWALFVYVAFWAIPYYLFFFVFAKEILRRGGFVSMFDEMRRAPGADKILLFGGDYGQELKYSIFHCFLCAFSFLLGPLLWQSFQLHSIFLGIIFMNAVYNGATYNFRVFAKKYYTEIANGSVAPEESAEESRAKNSPNEFLNDDHVPIDTAA